MAAQDQAKHGRFWIHPSQAIMRFITSSYHEGLTTQPQDIIPWSYLAMSIVQ